MESDLGSPFEPRVGGSARGPETSRLGDEATAVAALGFVDWVTEVIEKQHLPTVDKRGGITETLHLHHTPLASRRQSTIAASQFPFRRSPAQADSDLEGGSSPQPGKPGELTVDAAETSVGPDTRSHTPWPITSPTPLDRDSLPGSGTPRTARPVIAPPVGYVSPYALMRPSTMRERLRARQQHAAKIARMESDVPPTPSSTHSAGHGPLQPFRPTEPRRKRSVRSTASWSRFGAKQTYKVTSAVTKLEIPTAYDAISALTEGPFRGILDFEETEIAHGRWMVRRFEEDDTMLITIHNDEVAKGLSPSKTRGRATDADTGPDQTAQGLHGGRNLDVCPFGCEDAAEQDQVRLLCGHRYCVKHLLGSLDQITREGVSCAVCVRRSWPLRTGRAHAMGPHVDTMRCNDLPLPGGFVRNDEVVALVDLGDDVKSGDVGIVESGPTSDAVGDRSVVCRFDHGRTREVLLSQIQRRVMATIPTDKRGGFPCDIRVLSARAVVRPGGGAAVPPGTPGTIVAVREGEPGAQQLLVHFDLEDECAKASVAVSPGDVTLLKSPGSLDRGHGVGVSPTGVVGQPPD